jgi:hypothetical protein
MKFDIYCDESCLEALTKKESHPFVGIGGLWLPTEKREETKTSLKDICRRHNINKEFKWNKLSPYYLDFYKEIIDYFYYIFLDYKLNRNKGRLNELRKVLQYSNLTSTIGLV